MLNLKIKCICKIANKISEVKLIEPDDVSLIIVFL